MGIFLLMNDVQKLHHISTDNIARFVKILLITLGENCLQFVYESEKKEDDSHNKLLKQIQTGVRLRKVKCNDRSKPNLDGTSTPIKQLPTHKIPMIYVMSHLP